MNITTTIPLGGVPCGRCGYPAHALTPTDRGSLYVLHLDPRVRPCPAPNTTGGRP